MPCRLTNSYGHLEGLLCSHFQGQILWEDSFSLDCLRPKFETVGYLETSETVCQTTQRSIRQDRNIRKKSWQISKESLNCGREICFSREIKLPSGKRKLWVSWSEQVTAERCRKPNIVFDSYTTKGVTKNSWSPRPFDVDIELKKFQALLDCKTKLSRHKSTRNCVKIVRNFLNQSASKPTAN